MAVLRRRASVKIYIFPTPGELHMDVPFFERDCCRSNLLLVANCWKKWRRYLLQVLFCISYSTSLCAWEMILLIPLILQGESSQSFMTLYLTGCLESTSSSYFTTSFRGLLWLTPLFVQGLVGDLNGVFQTYISTQLFSSSRSTFVKPDLATHDVTSATSATGRV